MEVKSPGFPDSVSAINPGECFILTRSEGTFVGIKTIRPVTSPPQYPHWCVVISPGQPRLINVSGMADRMAIRLTDAFIEISGNPQDVSSRELGWSGSISVSPEKDVLLVTAAPDDDWILVNLANGEITENFKNDSRSSFLTWSLVRVVNEKPETIFDFKVTRPTQT